MIVRNKSERCIQRTRNKDYRCTSMVPLVIELDLFYNCYHTFTLYLSPTRIINQLETSWKNDLVKAADLECFQLTELEVYGREVVVC